MIYNKIKILGSKKFTNQTIKALELIEKESKLDFNKITKYLKSIKQSNISGIDLKKSQYNVSNKTAFKSIEWYASTIIHDTHHYYLYKIKRLLWIPKNYEEHERLCMKEQIRFLKKINAHNSMIKYCKNIIKTKYWLKERNW